MTELIIDTKPKNNMKKSHRYPGKISDWEAKKAIGLRNTFFSSIEYRFKPGDKVNGFTMLKVYPHHTLWQYDKGGWKTSFAHNEYPSIVSDSATSIY